MNREPGISEKHEVATEADDTDMQMLARLLSEQDFEEPPELAQARHAIVSAAGHSVADVLGDTKEARRRYTEISERIVDERAGRAEDTDSNPEERVRLHLTLLLHEAAILRMIGDQAGYKTMLIYAAQVAMHTEHLEMSKGIQDVLDYLDRK